MFGAPGAWSVATVAMIALSGCARDGAEALPAFDPDADVRFVLEATYPPAEDVLVRIENVGDRSYVYRVLWPACALRFFADDGREFRVPTGVTCGEAGDAEITPGETVVLF
ncbi:MAG TPA: hypothetical protein VI997_10200 [Candidatus Thermoplasmatota archaeon]|nr:hypothetical protein [Candidatus Thermoplasmatota archaeon]